MRVNHEDRSPTLGTWLALGAVLAILAAVSTCGSWLFR